MAIKDFYPAIRPTLDLNFAASRIVDPRISFSRSGTGNVASYFDVKGAMKFAPPNVPRIDFDPGTGECKGLLMEGQRTNLLPYSEQFDNATWQKTRATVTANATTAPDGELTADKLVEDTTASATHMVVQNPTLLDNTTYCHSVYAKSGERTRVGLVLGTKGGGLFGRVFDLANGATYAPTSGASGSSTFYGIDPLPNGWWRCWVAHNVATGAFGNLPRVYLANGTDFVYTGDGTSGIYIWGAQLETGNATTSYIPTTTSQVTCSADTASLSGANFSSWNNTTGTILAKYKKSGWQHNNTPPSTQLDLAKYIQDYSTAVVSDAIERVMFYPRQLTEDQISALKG